MKKGQNKIWFPAKKYGVGWGFPISWQGWVVLLLYVLLFVVGIKFVATTPVRTPFFIFYFLIITCLLIIICWKKGEKIDFRLGKK
jgi:hypothetical protein